MKKNLLISLLSGLASTTLYAANIQYAPVSGFAHAFIYESPIANATVTVLETGEKYHTNAQGYFGPINYPVGQPITLELTKLGFKTTQTATVFVPATGLTGPYDNLTFQVPTTLMYYLLATIVGATIDDAACHVTSTITRYHKTLHDIPQGEPGAEVVLAPQVHAKPFYFDMFRQGWLKGKTNPFTHGLKVTSEDGGIAFFNLPVSDTPYVITANKSGFAFTKATFLCRRGAFINVSPPRGPMALSLQSSM